MKEVAFFEDSCSRVSGAEPLVEYLLERFPGELEVRSYDVGRAESGVPVPPELLSCLLRRGAACLPAMTIAGAVFTEGWLPSCEDAAAFVSAAEPDHGPAGTPRTTGPPRPRRLESQASWSR